MSEIGGLAASVQFDDAAAARAAPQLINHNVYFVDPADWTPGGTLTVTGLAAYDHVLVLGQGDGAGEVGVSGNSIRYGGVEIGTFTGGGGDALTISFNASASAAAVTAVASQLAYQLGTGGIPSDHSLNIALVDGAGAPVGNASQFDPIAGHAYPDNPFTGLPTQQFWVPTLGDINGDGFVDLILTGNEDPGWVRYDNPDYAAITSDWSAPTYGIDTDGMLMVRNGDGGIPGIRIYLNDQSGNYLPGGSITPNTYNSGDNLRVALADFNHDGFLDMVATGQTAANNSFFFVGVAYNDGQGNFSAPQLIDRLDREYNTDLIYAARFMTLAAGDVDRDGSTEVFAWAGWTTIDVSSWPMFVETTPEAYFGGATQIYAAVRTPGKSYLIDYDGDGDLDGLLLSPTGETRYLENDGSGGFTERFGTENPFLGLGLQINGLDGFNGPGNEYSFGDLDQDGDLDILYFRADGSTGILWNNSGYGVQSNSLDGSVQLNFTFPQAATADAYSVDEDQALVVGDQNGVLANDVLPGTLSAALATGPAHGSLVLNPNGSFTYVPTANYNGADSFTYRVNDGTSLSDPVTVTLTVNPVADPIVAVDDGGAVLATGSVTIEGLANDSNVDGLELFVGAINGQAITPGTDNTITLASGATLVADSDGHFVYTPGSAFDYLVSPATGSSTGFPSTAVDSFTYTTNSGSTATVSVTVTGVDGPGDARQSLIGGIASHVEFTDAAAVRGAPQLLNGAIYFQDPAAWTPGGTLTVTGVTAYDRISILSEGDGAGQVGASGNIVRYGGVAIGTVSGGNGTTLSIAFNNAASAEAVTAVTERLAYQLAEGGIPTDHDLHIGLVDGNGVAVGNAGQWDARSDVTYPAYDITSLFTPYLHIPVIGDLNGDGFADLIMLGRAEDIIEWHVVDEDDPDFVAWQDTITLPVYDFHDGVLVMRDGNLKKSASAVYINDQHGGFIAIGDAFTGLTSDIASATIADADGDGDMDLLYSYLDMNILQGRRILVSYNDGSGHFTNQAPAADVFDWNFYFYELSSYIAVGDVDQDGTIDIFLQTAWNTALLSMGDFVDWKDQVNPYTHVSVNSSPWFTGRPYLLDYDNDGDLDAIMIASSGINYFENTGHGVLVERKDAANPVLGLGIGRDSDVSFADLDGDGDLDIVVDGIIRWNNSSYGATPNSHNGNIRIDFAFPQAATADSYTIDEDQALTVPAIAGVLANDVLPGALTAVLETGPAHGSLTLNPNGSFTYTPTANYNGADSFTYRVNDGTSLSDPVTVSLTVNPVTDAIVAVGDNGTVLADASVTIEGLANDRNVDGLELFVAAINGQAIVAGTTNTITLASGATLVARSDGHFVYTPGSAYDYLVSPATGSANGLASSATDSFTYTTNSGSTATVSVTVTGVDGPGDATPNHAPSGTDSVLTIAEDGSHSMALADFGFADPDGDALASVTIVSLSGHGALTLDGVAVSAGQSVAAADIAAGRLVFAPTADAHGAGHGAFDFRVVDGAGGVAAATNTISFDVTAQPDGVNNIAFVDRPQIESTADLLFVEFRAAVAADYSGYTLTVSNLAAYDHVSILGEGSGAGQIGVSGGTITWGGTAIGTVAGGDGNTLTVTLNGSATTEAIDALAARLGYQLEPNAAVSDHELLVTLNNAAGVALVERSPWQSIGDQPADPFDGINVYGADRIAIGDINGDGYLDLVGAGTPELIWTEFFPQNGEEVNPDWAFPRYRTEVDGDGVTHYYMADEEQSAQPNSVVYLGGPDGTFTRSGTAPYLILGTDQNYSIGLGDADGDGDLDLFYANGHSPYWGINFSLMLNDGSGNFTDVGDVSTRVWNRFEPQALIGVASGDIDGDGVLDVLLTYGGGMLRYTGSGTSWISGTPTDSPQIPNGDGTFFTIPGSFSTGDLVLDTNGVPYGDRYISLVDLDGDGDLDLFLHVPGATVALVNDNGTFARAASAADPFAFTGNSGNATFADLNGDGRLDMISAENGEIRVYWNTSATGYANTAPGTPVSLDFRFTGTAPQASGATVTLSEDSGHTLAIADFGFSDGDGNALAAVIVTTLPAAGALTLNGVAVTGGQSISAADIAAGLLVFTPAADANGAAYAEFGFRVQDDSIDADVSISEATIVFNVTPVEDSSVAANDTASVLENGTVVIDVRANDSDVDSAVAAIGSVDGQALSVGVPLTIASGATVTLNANGTLTYNPNGQFNYLVSAATALLTGAGNASTTDSFSYTLGGGSTATVAVTVNGVDGVGDQLRGIAGVLVTGTSGADVFDLSGLGAMIASGGAGNDGFFFGANFDASDRVDGGAGTDDQIGLFGDYSITLGATTLTGIETMAILSGSNSRYNGGVVRQFHYDITMNDGNVAAGMRMTVNANNLQAGESLTFDGSAELDGAFTIYAGYGDDNLRGGQQSDGFFFGTGSRFTAADRIDGQGGTDDQLAIQGNYSAQIAFGADTMRGIETLVLMSGTDARFQTVAGSYSYNVALDDANVAAGERLQVSATSLQAAETLIFDGSAETDGWFRILSGAGDDVLIGGHGDDILYGMLGVDTLTGGAGNDRFTYTRTNESAGGSIDHITDFATGDLIDLSAIDANVNRSGNNAFAFIGSAAFHGVAGELRAYQDGDWYVECDVNGDGIADMRIHVTVADAHTLTSADFIL